MCQKYRKRKFALESDLMNLSLHVPNPKKAKSAEVVDKLEKIMDRDVRTGLCLLPRHEVSVFLEDYCKTSKDSTLTCVWRRTS